MSIIFGAAQARHLADLCFALATGVVIVSSGAAQSTASAADDRPVTPQSEQVAAGDDFDRYVNGAWASSKPLTQGSDRWSARSDIAATTRDRIDGLMRRAVTLAPGTPGRKLSDYLHAYADEAAIEQHGLSGVRPLLDRIEKVRTKSQLSRLLAAEMKADVDPINAGTYDSASLFGLAVAPDTDGHKRHVAYLMQGGLGMVDRDNYVGSSPKSSTLRDAYRKHVAALMALAGFPQAQRRAETIVALETAIARTHGGGDELASNGNLANKWMASDFTAKAPGIDWPVFLAAARLSGEKQFVVWQPRAVAGSASLVDSQPLEAWKDYLRFHVVEHYADVLPKAISEETGTFHGVELNDAESTLPRAQRALDSANLGMPDALGKMYVDEYFPEAQKAKVREIAANVIQAFEKRIESVRWMTPQTKLRAKEKLRALYFGVGYPEHWADYSGLKIDSRDALANMRRVEAWNYQQALGRLARPADFTEWHIPAHAVAATSLPFQNAYNFCAGLLQPTKFDPQASDAANYGAIGAIIGHEVSHFFDDSGADYDSLGRPLKWWSPTDAAQFEAATAPLARQYSSYRPLPDLPIDGRLTLAESVADLGGLVAAFDAYRGTLGSRSQDRAYVREQDRQFFIGFARSWRSKIGETAMRNQLASNPHAPEPWRIATVRNVDAWYDAFDVTPGQRLYLDPKNRIRIW